MVSWSIYTSLPLIVLLWNEHSAEIQGFEERTYPHIPCKRSHSAMDFYRNEAKLDFSGHAWHCLDLREVRPLSLPLVCTKDWLSFISKSSLCDVTKPQSHFLDTNKTPYLSLFHPLFWPPARQNIWISRKREKKSIYFVWGLKTEG